MTITLPRHAEHTGDGPRTKGGLAPPSRHGIRHDGGRNQEVHRRTVQQAPRSRRVGVPLTLALTCCCSSFTVTGLGWCWFRSASRCCRVLVAARLAGFHRRWAGGRWAARSRRRTRPCPRQCADPARPPPRIRRCGGTSSGCWSTARRCPALHLGDHRVAARAGVLVDAAGVWCGCTRTSPGRFSRRTRGPCSPAGPAADRISRRDRRHPGRRNPPHRARSARWGAGPARRARHQPRPRRGAVASDPENASSLLAEARAASSQALAEIRGLVRGIHPPVLADRGLVGAVQALAWQRPSRRGRG